MDKFEVAFDTEIPWDSVRGHISELNRLAQKSQEGARSSADAAAHVEHRELFQENAAIAEVGVDKRSGTLQMIDRLQACTSLRKITRTMIEALLREQGCTNADVELEKYLQRLSTSDASLPVEMFNSIYFRACNAVGELQKPPVPGFLIQRRYAEKLLEEEK